MIPGVSELCGFDAINVGSVLLNQAGGLTAAPAGASASARRAAASFPAVLAEAQSAQDRLVACAARVILASAQHERQVAAALAGDRRVDALLSAIRSRLAVEVRLDAPGAQALDRLLFPRGLRPLTRPQGRPQLSTVQAWLHLAAIPNARENRSYGAIAALVETLRSEVDGFAATLQVKGSITAALAKARSERDRAQADWTVVFRELIGDAARIHGEDSAAFQGWSLPLRGWRASQKAARTRRARAAEDPGDPSSGG